MSILENLQQLDEKIYEVLNLLKEINYELFCTKLNDSERKKLFDFSFRRKGFCYDLSMIIEDLNYPEYVKRINKLYFDNLTPDVKEIIEKCGVDPKNIFVYTDSGSYECNSRIDPNLYAAMHGTSYAAVGKYIIDRNLGNPLNDDIDYTIKTGDFSYRSFPLIISSSNTVVYHGRLHQAGYPFNDDSDNIKDYQVVYDCLLDVEEALRRRINIEKKNNPNKKRLLDIFKRMIKRG